MDAETARLVGIQVGDAASAWRAAGFAVRDDLVTIGGVTLQLTGDRGPRGILGWWLDPEVGEPCDGLPAAPGPAPPPATGSDRPHPNGAIAVDHLVVGTDDVERTTSALGSLGLSPRRTVVGARGDGDHEVVYRFFLLGTCVLELVGPSRPQGSTGARFTGLAVATRTIDDLGDIAGPPRDAVQPGRRIATLRGDGLGVSVPVAFLTPRK